jgi:asparagine synthase (glutamine-hydrolysing)
MSGIAGIYHLDGRPAQAEDVRAMVRLIAHRGPDGSGTWTDGPVALGHCLLRTTPDAISQPWVHPSEEFAITAEVRLDNREELGDQLGLPVAGGTLSDAQLILAAYLKWGESCPEHLLGDFAFAIWDGRKRVLFGARDHMGVRPFIYHYRPGAGFAFGSEPKAVLAAPGVPFRVNEQRLADYLRLAFYDKEATFFEGVRRLPPGHWVQVDAKSCAIRPYWSPDPSREIRLKGDREYAEAFREKFTEAVRCRLRSSAPIASQLSGGLDSSLVTCVANDVLAAQRAGAVLHTVSCVFDDYPEVDERAYIEPVLARCGLAYPHYVHADQVSPLTHLEQALWHEDGLSYTHNGFTIAEMASTVSLAGARVMLDGLDGDTIVSHGWERLYELAFRGDWATFGHELAAMEELAGSSRRRMFSMYGGAVLAELARTNRWGTWLNRARGASSELNFRFRGLFKEYGLRPGAAGFAFKAWQRWRGRAEAQAPTLVHPDLAARTRPPEPLLVMQPRENSREVHYATMVSGAHATALEAVDRIASRFSVELRHPFFDRRVVEFCLALPADQKLKDGWGRIVMRRAMEGVVPSEVQWRKDKSRLSPNFINGLWRFERDRLESLRNNSACLEGLVDRQTLVDALDRFSERRTRPDADNLLWPALNLAAWLPGLEPRYLQAFNQARQEAQVASITG